MRPLLFSSIRTLLTGVLVFAVASPALAIPQSPPARDGRGVDDFPDRRERRTRGKKLTREQRAALEAKIERRIDTFVTVELSSELGLDEKEALKLLGAWREHRAAGKTANRAVRDHAKRLGELIDAKAADAQVAAQMKTLEASMDKRVEPNDLLAKTRAFLTVRQQAQLLLAIPQVEHQVRRMMRKARRKARGRGE